MTVKISNTIPLPPRLRKQWKGSRVVIVSTNDSLLVKRVRETPPSIIREKLKRAGRMISAEDIASAIRAARR